MPTQDVTYQQRLKIRRTTLGFGVIQVILGLALTTLSFTAFVLSESEKIRNACPYWAGFTVFCSGGVGIVAWRHSSVLSMGLFTFFSAVCVVLHMIGTILTGEVGGLLKSIVLCHQNTITGSCMCCDSIMTCKQNIPSFKFEGVEDCSILTGLLKELLYGLCVLNIFGSLVCFIATILGCTSVARQAGRDQPLFRRRLSAPSDSHEQSQYSWLHYPTDLSMLPPYAPPIYRSVDNFQDCGATPYIVPPPVFDPTDLPPPYTSRNASLSSSGFSLYEQSQEHRRGQLERDSSRGREGSASIVIQEVTTCNSTNQFQQRIYSENRGRPGNPARITSAILTRNGVLEFCSNGNGIDANRTADQSLNSSQASLQSEARRPLDIIGQRIEGIAQCIETRVFQRYEKAEECKELDESKKLDEIQGQNITNSQHGKWKYSYKQSTNRTQRCLSSVDHSAEIIRFEDGQHDCSKVINNNDIIPNGKVGRDITGKWEVSSSMQIEEESSSNSDSGLGEDLSPLSQSINSNNDYNASVNITCNDAGNGEIVDTETCHNQGDHMSHDDDISSLIGFAGNANTKDLTGDKDQGISEASCKEYGASTNLLDSSADNVFAVRWNLFGASCGFETSTSISGNDGKSFQPNPVLAKRCKTASSVGQECEEKGSPQYDEQQRSESQRQLLSKTMPGYSIHDDATCNMMMPMEINPNPWTSNEEHLQLMPSNATCQLSSDLGHKLLPSDSSHCELMMIDTRQHQLMPSDATHCQLSSDVGHKLTPSDSSHCKLMSVDTRQHQLMPSDATHCQLSSDTSHELTPSDSSHCKLMSVDTRQHQLMPSDATHCQLSSDVGHKLTPSDSSHCKLMSVDTRLHQLMPSDATHCQFSSDTSHELTPSDSSHCKLMSVDTRQHQLMPSDASHCQLSSDTSHEVTPSDSSHCTLMSVDTRQHQLMPSDASHKEPNTGVPDNPVGHGKLCEEGFPSDGGWHMLTPNDASYHQTYLNAKQQDKLKASDENQQLILNMDCDVLDSQRSADCYNDGYSEPVLESKSFRQKCSENMEFMMEESGGGLFKKKEIITNKETLTGNQNIMMPAGLEKTKKSDSKRKVEDIGIHTSDSKPADNADQVIRLMDDFHSSDIKQIQSEWGYTLAANFTETLSDSGSEHEEIPSITIKPLTWSDTCIARETNYLVPKEKTRTSSDPEVKGLRASGTEFTYHRKNIWNRGRLLYDDSFGVVPPNIELPLEMRNQGLVYCCPEDIKIQNRNTGNAEQGRKQRSTGRVNNLVKHQPKNPSCYHGNREALVKSKDDLLKKEQALMKTIKLRNEMSRSLMHLYREKKLNPRNKDSESLLRPGLEIPPNALKKRQLVQKGHMRNRELEASVEYPKKTGHHKHSAKDITGTGPDSPGKETFV